MGSTESGSDTLLILNPKPFKPFKSKDEYLYAMKEDLSEWFFCLYKISISVDNFFEVLETGVILCDHAVSVQNFARERRILHADLELRSYFIRAIPDGGIPCKHGVKPKTFHARDNVSNFISWCRQLGIPQVLLFETDDLVLRKNERSVVLCLLEVARIGAKLGMLAPVLVQMEEEIEAELAGEPPPQIITCDLRSLDEMVRALVGRCTCPSQFPIIQVGDGKYKIGDSQTLIFVRILRKHVMVRVGGGWDTLENYLDKHDPCRCGFRGHRNSPAPDQIRTTPKRKTSGSNPPASRPKTPTSVRKMTSTPTQHTVTNNNNKQLIVSRRPRSPSPARSVLSKSPFCPTNTNYNSQGHRVDDLSESQFRKAPRSTVIATSSARNGFHVSSELRRSSPSLSERVMSPGPESPQTPRSRIPEPSRPKTPTYRSRSPGPIYKPLAVRGEDSPDSNSRPKTPVGSRPKSPAIPRPVPSSRNLSQEFNNSQTTAPTRTKSPAPVYGVMETPLRNDSPDRGRQSRRKSPAPDLRRSHSREQLSGATSVTNSGPVSSSVDGQSSIPSRPKTPIKRPQSPCRIPRPKTPLHSSTMRENDTSATSHKQEKNVANIESSQTKSGINNMDSNGDINIDKISTMSLSEFKNLLSTSLAVPSDNSVDESPRSPVSSGDVNWQCSVSKPQPSQQASHSICKPPASPKRSRRITNAGLAKEEKNLNVSCERVRRSLPPSPAEKSSAVNDSTDMNKIHSSQVTPSHGTSSASDREEITRVSRPTTPSNVNSRVPRPKTPSGIPRPSTPVHSSSAKGTGLKPTSSYPDVRDTVSSSSSESLLRERSLSPQTVSSRPRSPSPPRRNMKQYSSHNGRNGLINPGPHPEASGHVTGNVHKTDAKSTASKTTSRLRPPSPSRFSNTQTVNNDSERGRQAEKTGPSSLFKKRPSSAGPAEVANSQRYISTRDSKEDNNSYVKRYFGRRNAKTIIKANSVSKAKSTQNVSVYSSNENIYHSGNGTSESNEATHGNTSRGRSTSQVSQVYQRPKSAGPRPFVRQEAVDKSCILVNRGGGGQHSVTVSSGEPTTYESPTKKYNRPPSAKSRATAPSGQSAGSDRSRARVLSKSVDLSERRFRTKSAGPRSVPSNEDVRTERPGICPKVRNKYVSTDNLINAWEEKISDKSSKSRRQLPSQPRRCVTPGPGPSSRPMLRSRSMTPNLVDDEELDPRPLEEIKAALKLPINGVHKIEIDPTKLGAPPEDAELFQKMEDLFHRYREKELSSLDMCQRGGVESASTTSEELDREQASADDESESVDGNANFRHRVQNGERKLSLSASDVETDINIDELENVKIGTSVIAQLTEILKPKPRKDPLERNVKSRIPAPQSRIPTTKSRIPAPQSRSSSISHPEPGCSQSNQNIADQFDYVYGQINGLCRTPINCVNNRVPCDLQGNKPEESQSYHHRDDSSTSLSDVSVSSSQGGYRCETPVPKLATPLCTGRSTLVSLRKERSSSLSSTNGSTTGRLVRAVSLDHSFTSTGNSLVDTSFSLAEDEDYV